MSPQAPTSPPPGLSCPLRLALLCAGVCTGLALAEFDLGPGLGWTLAAGGFVALFLVVQRCKRQGATQQGLQLQLLEHSNALAKVGGWEFEPDTGSLHWSDEVFRIHEVPIGEQPDTGAAIAFYREDARSEIEAAVQRCLASGTPYDLELPLQTRGGREIWVRTQGRADLEDGQVRRIWGTFQDITAIHRAQDELEAARQEAENANLAKSEFLANMSHEIRTPLTAILGFADLMADKAKDLGEEDRRAVETIRRNGQHLLSVINDILDLSKIEAGSIEIEAVGVDLAGLLAEVLDLLRVRADGKGIGLEAEVLNPFPAQLRGDEVRLRQILVNLMGNAIKFTEQGSVRLRVSYQSEAGELRIAVQDTGIGMTDGQIQELFQPFKQIDTSASRRFGGTGLGLCISRRLAEMMGGRIEVSSEFGNGSTFTLVLRVDEPGPLTHQLGRAKIDKAVQLAEMRLDARVLLAEDGPDNQRLIGHILRRAGAQLEIVDNGRDAVEWVLAAEANEAPYDLVLMDMQMPILDGYDATRQLRRLNWQGPIVALTAHAMTGDREKCLEAGCTDFATKPINRQKLLELCKQHQANAAGRCKSDGDLSQ